MLAVIGYAALTGFERVGLAVLVLAFALGLLAEALEWWLGMRFARRYGGSARAGWGALLGAIVGGIIGLPLPLIGSVVGAFVGAFAGAALFEWSASRRLDPSLRAGWGATLGKAFGTAAKMGAGIAIAIAATVDALR